MKFFATIHELTQILAPEAPAVSQSLLDLPVLVCSATYLTLRNRGLERRGRGKRWGGKPGVAKDENRVQTFFLENICSIVQLVHFQVLDPECFRDFREVLLLVPEMRVTLYHLLHLLEGSMLDGVSH